MAPRLYQFQEVHIFDDGRLRHVIKKDGEDSWSWHISYHDKAGKFISLDYNSLWEEYPTTLEEAYSSLASHHLGLWEYKKKYERIVAARERDEKREFSFVYEDGDDDVDNS